MIESANLDINHIDYIFQYTITLFRLLITIHYTNQQTNSIVYYHTY